ncbi:GntR family transcriptional regulator [Ruminococcaceae bacterium OttesenSCG-928-D13]|nr:GntR family transcriptional regulator [Ruminococcaceae bacterium OttesenSCG-928-D13]
MSSLRPIKLLPARERVSAALREAILRHELKAEQEITLEGIAEQLGVSITPVREAFQTLASDGLIKLRPNKGAVVLGVTSDTIRDHYETRALLEAEAAARVCQNGADITDIVNAYERAEEALARHDTDEYSNFNQAFHYAIWSASGNKKMEAILSSLWNGLSMGHKVTEEAYARISTDEHAGIVEAIKSKDAMLARERMNAHILRSLDNILTNFPN